MPSDGPPKAYVWAWLPGTVEPVVAGVLERRADLLTFAYGQSYRARDEAVPLYLPELPVRPGIIDPPCGLRVAGVIADAAPDAWGQRVILNWIAGAGSATTDSGDISLLTYLLKSGSDRTGNLDFQASATEYVPRVRGRATLQELAASADRVERGEALSPALDQALLHGSSIGGARPKALLDDGNRRLIAKFSSSTDAYPVVKGEFAAMELARRANLQVAPVEITTALGRDVLLVERFDRHPATGRRAMVSALTILGLDEMAGRYASYADLAVQVRERFNDPGRTLRELFSRITFNVLVGNTDDHARNHAAFWHPDHELLSLTPAYDICPQPRSGGEASQAMAIAESGWRMSQIEGCVRAAPTYLLTENEAREIADRQVTVIREQWHEVAELARMTEAERSLFWGRQFLNPFALQTAASPP